jgi:predicted RNA binding protein YcfA (HicA-like mRNA interferase family)
MSKRKKLLAKLRNNPKAATMQQLETLLGYFGFQLSRVTGSHHIFIYTDGEVEIVINVPLHGKKVKTYYVKQALDKIKPLVVEDEAEDGDDNHE